MNNLDNLKTLLQHQFGSEQPVFRTLGDIVTASKICSATREEYSVSVPLSSYEAWQAGALAQRVFPSLTNDEREFLISGQTPAEYERLFRSGIDREIDF